MKARKPADADWLTVREVAAGRSGGRCERCGEPFPCAVNDQTGDVMFVFDGHHRKLRSQGGPNTVANCAALDRECHRWAHDHPQAAQALGLICPSFREPEAWALLLPDSRTVLLTEDGQYLDIEFGDAA